MANRPIKYSTELALKIANIIAKGLTDKQASAICDLNADTLNMWRQRRPEFVELLAKADAQRVLLRVEAVESHQEGWQSAAWLLERTKANQFAKPETQAQINVIQQTLMVPGLNISQAELQSHREQLNRLQAVPGSPGELNPFISLEDCNQPSRNS